MPLSLTERRLGLAERLARCFPDDRDPTKIRHTRAYMIRARIHAIACGYEDADDPDTLRADPAFKLACGRLPETGADLCSQPTLSRLENAPSLKDAIRLTYVLVDQWMRPTQCRRPQSRSTSTTPATSPTAISNCPCSTPAAMSVVSCLSTSTIPRRAARSRWCCARQDAGRRRSARASAPRCASRPQILAQHPHHVSGRLSLWPPRSDAMV